MENYFKIIKELEHELTKTKQVSTKLFKQMEFTIDHCQIFCCNWCKKGIK